MDPEGCDKSFIRRGIRLRFHREPLLDAEVFGRLLILLSLVVSAVCEGEIWRLVELFGHSLLLVVIVIEPPETTVDLLCGAQDSLILVDYFTWLLRCGVWLTRPPVWEVRILDLHRRILVRVTVGLVVVLPPLECRLWESIGIVHVSRSVVSVRAAWNKNLWNSCPVLVTTRSFALLPTVVVYLLWILLLRIVGLDHDVWRPEYSFDVPDVFPWLEALSIIPCIYLIKFLHQVSLVWIVATLSSFVRSRILHLEYHWAIVDIDLLVALGPWGWVSIFVLKRAAFVVVSIGLVSLSVELVFLCRFLFKLELLSVIQLLYFGLPGPLLHFSLQSWIVVVFDVVVSPPFEVLSNLGPPVTVDLVALQDFVILLSCPFELFDVGV